MHIKYDLKSEIYSTVLCKNKCECCPYLVFVLTRFSPQGGDRITFKGLLLYTGSVINY